MPLERESNRIVIAGASSLLGAEVKSLLEEGRFAASDFRLLDEDLAAGILTAAGDEPVVIQPVEEGSFARARFVFFTGSARFTLANLAAAQQSGAKIIDLSGALSGKDGTETWFPKLENLSGKPFSRDSFVFAIPGAAATAASSLALGLRSAKPQFLSILVLQSVSDAGRAGIEELESQTSQLLSMQTAGKPVFDAQVAFNTLDRFGPATSPRISSWREGIQSETRAALTNETVVPAIQVVHVPVFYGTTFSACAVLNSAIGAAELSQLCKDSGFIVASGDDGPSNVSVAGVGTIQIASPASDAAQPRTWWFWGAADNIRLPAANAVRLADLLASQ
jgi:aspartate-semialdehyde dehydrogenase